MDAKAWIVVFGILVATASCESSTELPKTTAEEDKTFVPGVFIPAETLKSLQEKAKKTEPKETDKENKPESVDVAKKSDQITFPDELPQEDPEQRLHQHMNGIGNQQNYPPTNQMYGNQPIGNQPGMPTNPQAKMPNQQPGYQLGYQPAGYQQPGYQPPIYQQSGYQQPGNQQPSFQPPVYQQPSNQQPGYQQPGYQPPVYQQPGNQQAGYLQPGYQPPVYQQPGNQQPGYQQPGYQQLDYQQNNMGQPTILLTQQPGYNSQNMPVNQQPMQFPQPNQQYFIPNGQMPQGNVPVNTNYAGQPNLNANNPDTGSLMTNMGPNQGTLYAMVPVNNANAMPNTNLNSNNGYFVPVQQMPSNGVLMNTGK